MAQAVIAHPIEVGSLLRRAAQPDEIIAARLLRDVLGTSATTGARLHRWRSSARPSGAGVST